MDEPDGQIVEQETSAENVFIAPSIHIDHILAGSSYTHHSALPNVIAKDMDTECVLGVDEAGRGPVLGESFPCPNTIQSQPLICQALWSTAFAICL